VPLSSGLQGQRVLVTGASQGIGFGAARALLDEGAKVAICAHDPGRLERAAQQLGPPGAVHSIVADLTRKEDLDRLVEETVRGLGGLDTLVYVTGSPTPGTFLEQGYEDWEAASRLLVVSPAYLARRASEAIAAGGHPGRMVFLASIAIREPLANIALSSVCRIAIAGLVRTLARELGPKGIRVNGILPGQIRTDRTNQLARDVARRRNVTEEQAIHAMESEIPLGRIGTTEELARTIIFLGSEMSAYVTGAMVPVDGGLLRSVG
jgi:3-oxoacyl-[acyl-carrier protein] reductase